MLRVVSSNETRVAGCWIQPTGCWLARSSTITQNICVKEIMNTTKRMSYDTLLYSLKSMEALILARLKFPGLKQPNERMPHHSISRCELEIKQEVGRVRDSVVLSFPVVMQWITVSSTRWSPPTEVVRMVLVLHAYKNTV